ncbi:MarR family winged helix-turn-helix transcriptional regulator [Streptomyces sp. NPDC091217]|uniref:MarR family winged helix-turn-helix transcriptional regulator n=1 Tax=Streptomyces sp. NPDC091217 TaxID=3365975 RepID=UPI00382C6484
MAQSTADSQEQCPAASSETVPFPAAAGGGPVGHALFRAARISRMVAGQLLRRVGLYPGQELVMMQLWELGPQRQTDLVRLLASDAATMTRTVRRLEHAGFVRRFPCAHDKRAFIIEATPASQALRKEVEQIWTELENALVGDTSDDEKAAALHFLEGIESRLVKASAQLGS